jgi:hypothetical protein
MRLRSDIFVSALVRRVFSGGGFAAVEHKGADAAGAIFLRQRHRDGSETLYGPAPQNFLREEDEGERKFEIRLKAAVPDEVADLVGRERRFDPDLWLVELETEDVANLIPIVDTER